MTERPFDLNVWVLGTWSPKESKDSPRPPGPESLIYGDWHMYTLWPVVPHDVPRTSLKWGELLLEIAN